MSDVTRATTFALAVEKAVDPTTVREVTHDAFNEDAASGVIRPEARSSS